MASQRAKRETLQLWQNIFTAHGGPTDLKVVLVHVSSNGRKQFSDF